eukprot:Rhum_TRINITY_DN2187_c0_g1::Rhum_TRINITY_DN2187_c0_g1_i1::g.6239::m.6239/K08857/NEK1_4_5; NIMA (never in mitosis gene a)-related kinase 1/4/5
MHHRAGSRRPKGFGLFDTGAAPTQCATPNFMPVLDDSPRPEWLGSVEVENAMKERNLEFRKNGAARVEVGRGAFAKAYLAEDTRDKKREFVIKEVDLSTLKEDQRKKAGLEVTFLKSLNHFNVIRCCDAFKTANILHIVLEYAGGGTLMHAIDAKKAEGALFPPEAALRWLAQLNAALRHLHTSRVLHRDLKTANVFLDVEKNVKLGDFGLSRKLEDAENFSGQMVGTPYYFAPEVVNSKPFSNKTDVWSAGVIAYEVAFLKKPFQAKSMKGLYKRISECKFEAMPDDADARISRLVTSILQLEPKDRPSASTLCKDPDLAQYVVADPEHTTPLRRHSSSPAIVPALPTPTPARKSNAVSKMLASVSGLAPPATKKKPQPALPPPTSPPKAAQAPAPVLPAAAVAVAEHTSEQSDDEYGDDFEEPSGSVGDFEEDCDDYEDDFESYDDSLVALDDAPPYT